MTAADTRSLTGKKFNMHCQMVTMATASTVAAALERLQRPQYQIKKPL